eukprot:GEMP01063174.1.p1 GENE.GEMP01063174.1~~GEMP01063174.1.p1  ORF type:complete len:273 (+),score=66.41 GEMP01063174.1:103-921(+)
MTLYLVDAFTGKPFRGNPAAICIVDDWPPVDAMQHLAAELGFSETAYVFRHAVDGQYPLRWFTPTTEVDLCGHGTLATAKALVAELNDGTNGSFVFSTRSGPLTVKDGTMTFPAYPPIKVDIAKYTPILEALALGDLKENPQVYWSTETKKLIVMVADDFPLKELVVDSNALGALDCEGVRGVAITQRFGEGFASRYFAPWNGIPEDPVNGSSHTVLIPLWSSILNKKEMTAAVLSARGGKIGCKMMVDTVEIQGEATIIFAKGCVDPRILA